ncbi:MAG: cysteine peptidase family C39 domain-containing protein [Phycisphaerae bacterium]|nr:cysteine peptidase family C39 domain-containing protein [Phycisphaerae bacterium]
MKTVSFLLTIVASLCLSTAAWGQQTLSNAEVQQILQQVTSQPRKTWISVGTITATHQEYGAAKTTDATTIQNEIDKAVQEYQNSVSKNEKTPELQKMKLDAIPFNVRYNLSNEWAMSSHVTVKYDNGRFYWEISVDSRQDSVKPDATLAGNYMTKQFTMSWNQRRIFAWDGQEYTTYSVSGGQATVDAAGKLQHTVTGPLTAGLIPWGYGRFSQANLDAAKVSAKRSANGTIDMTIAHTDGTSTSLTLDSAKSYAVIKAVLTNGGATATYTCSDYRQVAGNWVPYNIQIGRQTTSLNNRLPTSEQWTFTSVATAAPMPGSFNVPVAANALVEYSSPLTASSAIYVQSDMVDTRGLLAQRLAFAATEGSGKNCATAVLQQAALELGKSIPDSALARLVGEGGRTSLYDMMRLAQSQGLFCRAVKTDLATLKNLSGVKAILHIPGTGHFVLLNEVTDHDVWLTDLSSRKFLYRQSVDFFPMDWSEGTALLLSTRPLPGQPGALSDATLATIAGGAGYACNTLLQEYEVYYCIDEYPRFAGCDGAVTVYFERWGCGPAQSGSCVDQGMESSIESPCIWDPYSDCTITGEWYYGYMHACQ